MSVDRGRLFDVLARVPFHRGGWVVAGSGPLLAMEIIDSIEDVDVVADAATWAAAVPLAGGVAVPGLLGDRRLGLSVDGADVEVFDGWLGIGAGEIIAEAVDIEGYLFMPLERVVESKRTLARPKDLLHLQQIARFTGERSAG